MDIELYNAAKDGNMSLFPSSLAPVNSSRAVNFESTTTQQRNNVLHIAARHGRSDFVHECLKRWPSLSNQVNFNGDTPLHVAASHGHRTVAELLVTNHSFLLQLDNGEEAVPPLCQMTNSEGSTALHEALRNGHEEVGLFLAEMDGDTLCSISSAGESALYLAAETCCEKVIAKILDSGLPYSVNGPHGQNVLHAAKHCSENTVDLMLRRRPDLTKEADESGKTALHYAVQGCHWRFIIQLLQKDASIAYIADNQGFSPILTASSMGSWGICRDIIKFCPDSVEARDNTGKNVVHHFKVWSRRNCKKFLQIEEIRELVNERDIDGNTPLHLAIKSRDYPKAIYLIPITNLRIVNKRGLTALDMSESDWAVSYKQRALEAKLRRKNATHGRFPCSSGFQNTLGSMFSIQSDREWREVANTVSVIAALLVTVTFAAVFTMPGGYNSEKGDENLGIANLIRKTALQIFILSDTVAMCTSALVVYMLVWALAGDRESSRGVILASLWMIRVALCATLLAFVTGLYTVTAQRALWVAILVCVICSVVLPFIVFNRWAFSLGVKGIHRQHLTGVEETGQ